MSKWLSLLAAALLALAACSLRPLEADRLFEANRLEEAEIAYRAFLDDHPADARTGQALYRLGLIYSLPDSPLYNPDKGRSTLRRLAEHQEGGLFSRQASFVLSLQLEISRLQQAAQSHASTAARLEDELGRLEEEAALASSEAGQQQDRARRLAREIGYLRSEIARLTAALEQREEELQKIKEIDLGRVP